MITQSDLHRFIYETGSPFKRLDALLADVRPNADLTPIAMTVGAPRHEPPAILETLAASLDGGIKLYPAITGTKDYRAAVAHWLERRYDIPAGTVEHERDVLALSGSREGLTLAGRCALDLASPEKQAEPVILMQNPFYQAYAVGALLAGAEVYVLNEDDPAGQSVPEDILARSIAAYIASPTNPQGDVLSHSDWHSWIELARLHGFYLFADECYSEIWRRTPPPGALETASRSAGGFRSVVAFNSLSKRSNMPGLRTGFCAGDPDFLAAFMKLRNMGGAQTPLPAQAAGEMAWRDETHVDASRDIYRRKWLMADEKLAPYLEEDTPPAGFFLWLKLPPGLSDIAFTKSLWADHAVKAIPGSYIAYPDERETGQGRIRFALVDDEATTSEALDRIASALSQITSHSTNETTTPQTGRT